MTAQELYRKTTARRAPVEIAELDVIDVLEAITGSRKAAETLAAVNWSNMLEKSVGEAMRELAGMPHVGPGIAAKVVLIPVAALALAEKTYGPAGDEK